MFSKETKYFIVFFISFSFMIVCTGWFGNFDYGDLRIPGTSFEVNLLDDSVMVDFPRDWDKNNQLKFENGKSQLFFINKAEENKKVKLKFRLFPVNDSTEFQFYINERNLGKFNVHKNSWIYTRIIDLHPGKNIFSIGSSNCKGECFQIQKRSIDVIKYKNIEEKEYFPSKNWFDRSTHKKIITPSELHLYNFDDNKSYVRLSFKVNSGDVGKNIQIFNGDKIIDSFELDDVYRFYRSPVIELSELENILTFRSMDSLVKFNIKDFSIEEVSHGEIKLGKGWYPIESWYHETPKRYLDFHWMSKNSSVYLYNSKNYTILRDIKIDISSYHRPRKIAILLDGEKIKERKVSFNLDEGRKEILLDDVEIEEGENKIRFVSVNGCDKPNLIENNNDERCLSFAFYNIYVSPDITSDRSYFTNLDPSYQFYFLLFSLVLFLSSIMIHIKRPLLEDLIDKRIIFAIIAIFLFSFLIRASGPKTFQLYLDEPWNIEVANNLYSNHRAQICSYQENNLECQNYFKPAGYPFYLNILFTLFDFNLSAVFWNSVLLGSLTPVLIFLLGYLFTKKLKLSILISFIFSIVPMHIFWSTTAESYVTSFFFILLSITLLYYYFERKDWKILFTSVSIMLYSVTFRPENVLLLALFPILLILEDRNKLSGSFFEFKNVFLLGIVLVYLFLYSKIFLSSLQYYRSVTKISLSDISTYIPFSFEFLVFLLVLVMGFSLVWLENKKLSKFLGTWTIVFSLPLIFHTGTNRMLIPLFLTLSFILAETFDFFVTKIKNKKHREIIFFSLLFLLVIIGIRMPVDYNNTNAKVLQTNVISNFDRNIPKECYIITEHSTLFSTKSDRVIPTLYALNNSEYIKNLASDECVLFFEGIGCKLNIRREGWFSNCKDFLESFEVEKYKEYDKENISYNFYRVK